MRLLVVREPPLVEDDDSCPIFASIDIWWCVESRLTAKSYENHIEIFLVSDIVFMIFHGEQHPRSSDVSMRSVACSSPEGR
jgi:hypothetical protein